MGMEGRTMRENPTHLMIMSVKPSGSAMITANGPAKDIMDLCDGDPCTIPACSDAVATEAVQMTEDAYADFCARHHATPIYQTLAAYPSPRR